MYAQNITTIAGGGTSGLGDGGPATAAQLNSPTMIAVDVAGNVFIADRGNSRIRKIDPGGTITTVAGGGAGGDGGPATNALLRQPTGVTFDASGNLYIAEGSGAHTIRKVNTAGYISTIAGSGTSGFSGDGGAATLAKLNLPTGIAVDPAGNVFIADWGNNRIRKVNPMGIISTIAGGGTVLGDGGPATLARLNNPYSVSPDISGNLFISDEFNHRLRRIDLGGIITTVAGTGVPGGSGDGGPAILAEFNLPDGIVADAGRLYIADYSNNRIRRVDLSTGIVTTVAGTGTAGFSGDFGPAVSAELDGPAGVVLDIAGNVYIADYTNNRIRKIHINNRVPEFTGGQLQTITICENSIATSIDSLVAVIDSDLLQTLSWSVFSAPAHGSAAVSFATATTGDTIVPSGLSYTPLTGYFGDDTFRVRVDDGISIDTITIAVTIDPLPHPAPISGPYSICLGSSAIFSDDSLGGVWSNAFSNITISSGGLVTGIGAGYDLISYTMTNACGSTSALRYILVDVFPVAGAITGPSTVCIGGTISLSDPVPGGYWSSSSTDASVLSGVVTGIALGSATISYSVYNSCGVDAATHVVTIPDYMPNAGIIFGSTSSICAGSSVTLSSTAPGGIWSATNSKAIVTGGVVHGITGGIDTIMYTVTNACGTASASYIVTINPMPYAGNIVGLSTLCPGDKTLMTNSVGGGVWSTVNPMISSVASSGMLSALSAGTDTVKYTKTNSCGSTSAKYTITVLPQSVCAAMVRVLPTDEGMLYPNPNDGVFSLLLSSAIDEQAEVTITDVTGRKVKQLVSTTNVPYEIRLTNAGIYIINAVTARGVWTDKVTVR